MMDSQVSCDGLMRLEECKRRYGSMAVWTAFIYIHVDFFFENIAYRLLCRIDDDRQGYHLILIALKIEILLLDAFVFHCAYSIFDVACHRQSRSDDRFR